MDSGGTGESLLGDPHKKCSIPAHTRGSDRLFESSGRGVGMLPDGGIGLHAQLWDGMHGSVVSGKQSMVVGR